MAGHARLDYEAIDYMIREDRPYAAIMGALHCSKSTIWLRRRALGLTGKGARNQWPEKAPDPAATVTLDLQGMAERAAAIKAKRLGMDLETFRRVWMPGKRWSLAEGFVEERRL